MSNKKAELDILGESHIPADLLTPTLGSNYGLDGYPDMEYGMGVLDGVLNPEFMEAPALPTGLSKEGAEEDGGMDLTMFMEDSLADLAWLDPTQPQDPERLPETPVSIPELEEAWGVHRRTNGIQVNARDLNQARYEDTEGLPKKANSRALMKVVRRAMQRSALGHDLDALLREAVLHLGDQLKRVASTLLLVKSEHGLAGNVFVRAAAYSGYGQGKWSDHFKKFSRDARYVVVSPTQMKTATWIQDGRCIYTGKIAVTEVPWGKAFAHYAPRLEASKGIKVASGDPQESLRRAFLMTPKRKGSDTGYLPSHDPSSREGFLAPMAEGERKVYTQQSRRVMAGVAKIRKAMGKGASGDYLKSLIHKSFREEDLKLAAKALTPLLMKTGALDERSEETTYEGTVFETHSMTRAASLETANAGEAKTALAWVRRSMSEGFAGKDLSDLIKNRFTRSLLASMAEPLKALRKAHEGGSGFLYVDAEAYASPAGVRGCESGSLKHRANQIPVVASMARCASCTLARTREDGTRKCSVYNKALLDDTSGPEIERAKTANIKVANMNDAEQTAAFFMAPENAYDGTEYGLKNANLDEVEIEFPENEKIAEITFGGWDL